MRKLWWVILLCSVRLLSARAQTASDAQTAFSDSLVNHHFVLKNFSGELQVHAKWVGTDLQTESPRWRALGLLLVQTVDLKGEQLEIVGDRRILVRDKTGQLAQSYDTERVTIIIDLNGSHVAAILPQLKDKLFFGSIEEALAAIPKEFREGIPASLSKQSSNPKLPKCDCAASDTAACVGHSPTAGTHPPRVTHEVDLNRTKTAFKENVKGSLRLALLIDRSGRVADLWIVSPFTLGLDQEAAQAARQFEFAPATCHGETMPTTLFIDVDYPPM